jgi:hypothetical protein
MFICVHGSLDGFCLVHIKLLEDVICILDLANEGLILQVALFKIQEKILAPYHIHFKPIGHDFTEHITKRLISRNKYYAINIIGYNLMHLIH